MVVVYICWQFLSILPDTVLSTHKNGIHPVPLKETKMGEEKQKPKEPRVAPIPKQAPKPNPSPPPDPPPDPKLHTEITRNVTVQVIDDSGNNDGGLSPRIAAAHAAVR